MQLLKLSLLRQILLANNPVADTSVQTLLSQANCFTCIPPGMWSLIELVLLTQIVNNGGGGGGGGGSAQLVLYTTTSPTVDGVVPANQNANAIAYRADGTQPIFVWDPVGHAWH